MLKYISKSLLLLAASVFICSVLYPLALWTIGQTFFPFQANGSILQGHDGAPVGSRLIAQPFTKDEYFQPRPSAASYDASASASSTLAPSNYALRDRVARTLGPLVTYNGGTKDGKPAAPDIESWFQKDLFHGKKGIVTQWADLHNSLAQAWVKADPVQAAYVDDWAKTHPDPVAGFIKDNPGTPQPKAVDLAVVFFENISQKYPGKFPSLVTKTGTNGKTEKKIELVSTGSDIQSVFFDMWRDDHPDIVLQDVPGDLVTTSASGLDPHITLQNAQFQLDRVATKWAANTKRDTAHVRQEIENLLQEKSAAPWGGIAGEKFVNVLEVNLELRKRYGTPQL
jgi:potassium-transporting ATPase KdpC subunit